MKLRNLQIPSSSTVPSSSNKTKDVQLSLVKLGKISDIGYFLIGFLEKKDKLHPSQNRNGKFDSVAGFFLEMFEVKFEHL